MTKILEARVKLVNRAHAYAKELHTKLLEVFTPFVGTKVVKVDGTLIEKIKKLVPDKHPDDIHHVYHDRSDYSLGYVVKTCIGVDGIAYYHDVHVSVGELRDGVLAALRPDYKTRSDYTVDEVLANREDFKVKEAEFRAARDALYPFGEYDR
jgi:hypothetical protein